jgi:hypothetical protein
MHFPASNYLHPLLVQHSIKTPHSRNTKSAPLSKCEGEFHTFADLNNALARLWTLLADDRISRKRAATLAYLGSLILRTIAQLRSEASAQRIDQHYRQWQERKNAAQQASAAADSEK